MTLSPLLQNHIEQKKNFNNEHEKIYQNLKRHANDVRPNAPKARLVEETFLQSIKSYLQDTKQDFVNFSKTIKTGQMSDNNLGRMNDLGMKIGGLLIASYLALHSKSKQESIMRFVGTGAFFASMKLWPKLFINLPAKIVHNVDVGKQYISAQGDKKDFYLDNQYLPWDITDIEDEKERRRHQKVALQNRTLWMATAGVSVPVMTALISNRLEPVVARLVALKGAFNVNRNELKPDGIEAYISPKRLVAKNVKEVEELCKQYEADPLNPEFAKELEQYMRIDKHIFKDPDWAKTIKNYSPVGFDEAVNEVWKEKAKHEFTLDEFKEFMKKFTHKGMSNFADFLSENGKGAEVKKQAKRIFTDEEVNDMAKSLFGESKTKAITYKDIEKAIETKSAGKSISSQSAHVQKWLKRLEWDNEDFFKTIQDYHKTVIPAINTRISKYLKLMNPVVGSTADSVYTNSYSRTMKNLFKRLNYSIDSQDSFIYKIKDYFQINVLRQDGDVVKATKHVSLKDVVQKDRQVCTDSLVNYFKALVEKVPFGSDEYNHIIEDLTKTRPTYHELRAAGIVSNPDNIELIKGSDGSAALNKAILGKGQSSITNVISKYASEQKTNLDAIISRLAICANFEARLKEGKITIPKEVVEEVEVNGVKTLKTVLVNKDIRTLPDALKIARKIIYEGCVSQTVTNNAAGSINRAEFFNVVDALYNKQAFENEPVFVKQSVAKLYNYIKNDSDFKATDKYLANSDLYGLVKEYASSIYPGMSWLKKAGIAGAVVAGVTLLVQPLFGKIKNEFPKENKKEGGAN